MVDASGIELRPATSHDAGAIAELWRLGWRDGHLGLVPPELAEAYDVSVDYLLVREGRDGRETRESREGRTRTAATAQALQSAVHAAQHAVQHGAQATA